MSHRWFIALAVVAVALDAHSAGAQGRLAEELVAPTLSSIARSAVTSSTVGGANAEPLSAVPQPSGSRSSSPLLWSLYVSNAAVHALDIHSTLWGIRNGAVEGNRLMAGVTSNTPLFIATKVGISAATIYAANRISRHNRVAAIATLVGINSAYAIAVAHNYRIARGLR